MAETAFPLEPCGIVQIEAWPSVSTAFEAELAPQLGGKLPATCGEAVAVGEWLAIRIAPCRFWLIGGASVLPLSIDPNLGCALSLGESRMRLRLRGPHAFDILKACVAVDWDAPEAAPGRAIQTSFHHVPVLALRTAVDACDLLLPRSFARSLAEWVAEIAAPYEAHSAEKVPA